nr:Chain B, Heat shock protein beta-1 [Homo sapiens]4MJH_D Chain D, Heat shock protein beta-1 [Homo sapiens]
ITIPVTFE